MKEKWFFDLLFNCYVSTVVCNKTGNWTPAFVELLPKCRADITHILCTILLDIIEYLKLDE